MAIELGHPEQALLAVGHQLRDGGYEFTTVTPETHRRNNARSAQARSVRDVFGWSRPFAPSLLPTTMLAAADAAGIITREGDLLRTTVRFSTLGSQLFVHSAYPTSSSDAVFFGPDTYRFCALLARVLDSARRCVDVGCGSGAGGLSVIDRVDRLVLSDVNAQALRFARVNAHLARAADRVDVVRGDLLTPVDACDLIIANPPYLIDTERRAYRHGGGTYGEELAVRIVEQACERLTPRGRLVLYTGAPIVDGRDVFRDAVSTHLTRAQWTYEELDPDVFGEQLDQPAYAEVERIAAVALVATMTA